MSEAITGPARIERDGNSIKLISNENTYVIISPDKIVIAGNVIFEGGVEIKTGVGGATFGTSIMLVKDGVAVGNVGVGV